MSYRHEASGADLHKEIAAPHITTFGEVFEDFAPFDLWDKNRRHPFKPQLIEGQAVATNLYNDCAAIFRGYKAADKHPDYSMKVGPFCTRIQIGPAEHWSASVRCADWVLSRVRELTILIPGDTMHFEIVDHPGGWSLVTAQHGQVMGSVWLAYIKTETIPVFKKEVV